MLSFTLIHVHSDVHTYEQGRIEAYQPSTYYRVPGREMKKRKGKVENGEEKGKRKKKELMQRGPMGLQGAPRKSKIV